MNDDDLERRFARLRPTDLPGGLFRQLQDMEPAPAAPTTPPLHRWLRGLLPGLLRPWGLAYAGIGAAWVLIFALHLLTQPAASSGVRDGLAAAPFNGPALDAASLLAVDRTIPLTRRHSDLLLP